MYYLDKFHTGYIVVDNGTFFCKCCVFACQHRFTNALRYTIIEMTSGRSPGNLQTKKCPVILSHFMLTPVFASLLISFLELYANRFERC